GRAPQSRRGPSIGPGGPGASSRLAIEREEVLVPAPVGCQFRMEGERQPVSLLERDRLIAVAGKLLHAGAPLSQLRGADEDGRGGAPDRRRFNLRFEAVDLTAVGVPPDANVHQL